MNPLENRGGIRPLPPKPELKEAGTSPKLEAQVKLGQKAAAEIGAPPSNIPAVPFAARPRPAEVFAGKLTAPAAFMKADSATIKYGLVKEVSLSLNPPKVDAPSNKPNSFNPTQTIDQIRQKADQSRQKANYEATLQSITQKKVEVTQKTLETLTQNLDAAKASQREIRKNGKDDPAFHENHLKSAQEVKAIKKDIQECLGTLDKLGPQGKLVVAEFQIKANQQYYTQPHFDLLLNKAKLEKEVAVLNHAPENRIKELDKNIKKLEKNARIILATSLEVKATGQSYIAKLERFDKLTGNMMQQDKKFYSSFFDNKLIIEKTLNKSKKFENKLNQCKTSEEIIKCYQSPEFIEYTEAIKEYSLIHDNIAKLLPTFDLEKINSKLPEGHPAKVAPDQIGEFRNNINSDPATPVQRFLKHPLLLRSILEKTPKEDANEIIKSIEKVAVGAKQINERSRELSTLADLKELIDSYKPQKSRLSRLTKTLQRRPVTLTATEENKPVVTQFVKIEKMISETLILSQSSNKETVQEARNFFESMKANRRISNIIENDPFIESRIATLSRAFEL